MTTTEPSADPTAPLTGGQSMARQLAAEGVTHIFGIPGIQLDYASNGLAQYRDQITFVNARHEQTTTYAADGYARTTGKIGVAMVVPGPGVLNAAAGLVTARACSSKVLLLSGQIPTRHIGQGYGLLHEIPDQSGLLQSLCRSSTLVTDPGQVAGAVHGAIVQLQSGPGPVAVEIPPDVLSGLNEGPAIGPEPAGTPDPGSAQELAALAERLSGAERPVIVAGGGAVAAGAWDELMALAQTLGAPLVATPYGKGSFDDRHPLAYLPLCSKELLGRADAVLFVGSRGLDTRANVPLMADDVTTLALNTDPGAFTPPRDYELTVTGDARTGTAALVELLAGSAGGSERAPWLTDADDVRQRVIDDLAPLEPQMSYVRALRDAIPDDGVLVNELTQVGYVANYAYDVRHPRSYTSPGYQGTLGYGFPTAIGAAVGNPDRPVISVNGDGGFGYGLAELATVANHDIPLVAVVFSDGAYGNVQRMHHQQFDGVHHGTELTNPDLVALAAAYGISGHRAETPDDLRRTLSAAIDARRPALIDVPLSEVPDPWGIVMKPWKPPTG